MTLRFRIDVLFKPLPRDNFKAVLSSANSCYLFGLAKYTQINSLCQFPATFIPGLAGGRKTDLRIDAEGYSLFAREPVLESPIFSTRGIYFQIEPSLVGHFVRFVSFYKLWEVSFSKDRFVRRSLSFRLCLFLTFSRTHRPQTRFRSPDLDIGQWHLGATLFQKDELPPMLPP